MNDDWAHLDFNKKKNIEIYKFTPIDHIIQVT